MASNSLFWRHSSTPVLLPCNTHSGRRACGALALALCGALWPSSAKAAEAPVDSVSERTGTTQSKVEVLAHAFYGDLAVGMLGGGIEGVYMMNPHWGFGGTVDGFYVDNGEYGDPGELDGGNHGLAFVEGDLLAAFITPYARVGMGAGRYRRFDAHSNFDAVPETDFVAELSGGLALRGGPVVGRAYASPTLFGKDFVMTYSVAIGARF
jgi:hypothetical protein